jgi:hypothetical protein
MTALGADDKDWRLQLELDAPAAAHRLVGRFRGPSVVKDLEAAASPEVVITHDGNLLFAYAADEAALTGARSSIEDTLRKDGVSANVLVSHWDEELDSWRQTDPPATDEQKRVEERAEQEAEAVKTQTFVAQAGKMIRVEFEQSMRTWADKLGLQCEIVEHPHLLRSQVAFTVTGPARKIQEFRQGLMAETWATVRFEVRGVTLSPL